MKKKIAVQDLRCGMYVAELDRQWIGTPFLFQGFAIKSDEQIEELKRQCQYVYIDTEQSYDVGPPHQAAPYASLTPDAIIKERQKNTIKFDEVLKKFTPGHQRPPRYQDQTALTTIAIYSRPLTA